MGGKQGSSSTQVEIPEWLDQSLKPFITDALERYDKFADKGFDVIMPESGTGVDVHNPWAISPLPTDPVPTPGAPPPSETPYDNPPSKGPPLNGGDNRGLGGGGGRSGYDRTRQNKN